MSVAAPWIAVTGTDTDVGKTWVTAGLLTQARRERRRWLPWKPFETGCRRVGNALIPADGERLAAVAGVSEQLALVAPFRYELPASPATCARREGLTVSWATLEQARARWIEAGAAALWLLEGAGGLLVPLGPEGLFADYLVGVASAVLMVVPDRLGCLNTALLSLEAARHRGLRVCGLVLNAVGPEPCTLEHRVELERFGAVKVWGPLPWRGPEGTAEQCADDLENAGLTPAALLETPGVQPLVGGQGVQS